MRRVFLDANVFFSGVRSAEGGSYFILELAKKKKIEACTVFLSWNHSRELVYDAEGRWNGRLWV